MESLERLIQHYWIHWTSVGGVGLAIIFKDFLIEASKGFAGKVGEHWQTWVAKFWNRRKKKNKQEDSVIIGALQQQVKDLMGFKKEAGRRLSKAEKRLELCQAERTECRADLKNLIFRVSALERKKA